MMLSLLNQQQKVIWQSIELAQKLYVDPECLPGRSPQKCCELALKSLEFDGESFTKWLLVCEANIWLCASILKDLRLLHVELDPLNSSADLFSPSAPRDRFVPKPVEELCLPAYRNGIRRLRQTYEDAHRAWRDNIAAVFVSLKRSAEKRAAVNITAKLGGISLLISTPLQAVEIFAYLYHWTKCAATLRWITTLLSGIGFSNTAANVIAAAPLSAVSPGGGKQADKYATKPILQQIIRMGKIVKENVDEVPHFEQELPLETACIATSFRYRLDSLTSFIDSFANLLPQKSPPDSQQSAATSISNARKYAGQVFLSGNRMDTCATISNLEDTQNFLDTFWYLQMVWNDALMQQRVGNVEWAAALFKEGYSIAVVLYCPYWVLKFSTHMAYLHAICEVYDSGAIEQLMFIRALFCETDTRDVDSVGACANSSESISQRANRKSDTDSSSTDAATIELSRLRLTSWPIGSQIELSRRAAECNGQSPMVSEVLECGTDTPVVSISGRSMTKAKPVGNRSRCICHHNLMDIHVLICETVCQSFDNRQLAKQSYLNVLSKICCNRKRECSCQFRCDILSLDAGEYAAFINEPLWNLLDFYLLLFSAAGGPSNLRAEEMRIVEKVIAMLPERNVNLFSLYFRLSFSYSITTWKLAKKYSWKPRRDVDTTPKSTDEPGLSQTNLVSDNVENGKRVNCRDRAVKLALAKIIDDVTMYGYTRLFPWYRSARRLLGSLYLHDTPIDLQPKATNWSARVAANFTESTAVSFRHAVAAREVGNDGEFAARLYQFYDEEALTAALAQLPSDWTVISLHLLETTFPRKLVLCRLSGRCPPIVVDLGDVIGRYDAISEFTSFVRDIDASIKETDKKLYWTGRYALEKKLESFLKRIEADWFGHCRALFCGVSQETVLKKRVPPLDSYTTEVLLTTSVLEEAEKKHYLIDMISLNGTQVDALLEDTTELVSTSAPVFLILDQQLHGIPFENMPVLRGQPVCRAACLQFLLHMARVNQLPKTVSSDRVYYVVNPSRDLGITEEYFKWFSRIESWRGSYGTQPDLPAMKEALASSDIYIYCGHNSGVKCLQSYRKVEQLSCKSVVLLMGCSSCKMVDRGQVFEAHNVALSYLLGQSPCVVGCLWSVTSPDIDRYLAQVLKLWLNAAPTTKACSKTGSSEIASLLCAIAKAKSACKLPLLTGAAVVSFGLPISCDQPFTGAE